MLRGSSSYGTFQGGVPSRFINARAVYSICLLGAVLVLSQVVLQTARDQPVEQYVSLDNRIARQRSDGDDLRIGVWISASRAIGRRHTPTAPRAPGSDFWGNRRLRRRRGLRFVGYLAWLVLT